MEQPIEEMSIEELRSNYPAVELIYPLAVNSYETAQKRYDAMDGRLQSILTLGVTVSLGVVVFAGGRGLSLDSLWFIAGGVGFVLAVSVGTYARLLGKLKTIGIGKLFNHYLDCQEWEFKIDFIRYAGDNYTANAELVNHKGQLANFAALLFYLAWACLAIWASLGRV